MKIDLVLPSGKNSWSSVSALKPPIGPQSKPTERSLAIFSIVTDLAISCFLSSPESNHDAVITVEKIHNSRSW
jgi:hypothetical protein